MTLNNPQAIDRLVWWRRVGTLLSCTGAFLLLIFSYAQVFLSTPVGAALYVLFIPAWIVAAGYEVQYLYRTRRYTFQMAYWDGYCPYCDRLHLSYQFALNPPQREVYNLVRCECDRDLTVHTDRDGYHHLE